MGAETSERVCGAFEKFTPPLRRLLDAGRHGSTATTASSTGVVPGAAQRREPVGDGAGVAASIAAFSHRVALGRRRRSLDGCRSIWVLGWMTLRGCGCWTAATSPSRE